MEIMMTYEFIEEGLKVLEGKQYIVYDYFTTEKVCTNIKNIDEDTNDKFIKFAIDKFYKLINRYVDNISFTVKDFDDIEVNTESLKGLRILEDCNHITIKQERYIARAVINKIKNQCIIKPHMNNTTNVFVNCRMVGEPSLVNISLIDGTLYKSTNCRNIEDKLNQAYAYFIYDNIKRFIESITKKYNSIFVKGYELVYNDKSRVLSYIVKDGRKIYYDEKENLLKEMVGGYNIFKDPARDKLMDEILNEGVFLLGLKESIMREIRNQVNDINITLRNSTLYYDVNKKLELNEKLYDARQIEFFNVIYKDLARERFKTILDSMEEVNDVNFMKDFLSKLRMIKSVYKKAYDGSTELEVNKEILLINPDNNKININDRITVDDYSYLMERDFNNINVFNDVRVYVILFRKDLIYNPTIIEMIKGKNIDKFLKCYPKHYLTKDFYKLKRFFKAHASYEHHKMIFLSYLNFVKEEFDIQNFNNNQCRIKDKDLIDNSDYNQFDKVDVLNINSNCIIKQICRINNMMTRKYSFGNFLKEIYKYNDLIMED